MIPKFIRIIFWRLLRYSGFAVLFSDRVYTKLMYWAYMGRWLDLANPVDFNQKEQWLKLYYRNPLYVTCADKYAVRAYVREKIGEKYLNECIGVFESVDEIDIDALPQRFVLKATHGSGWNIICHDKYHFDWQQACVSMRKWLKSDFSKVGREWQYREIKPRIVCEAFMEEVDGSPLRDYKLFTFGGVTKYIDVEFSDCDGDHAYIFDADWRFQLDKGIGSIPGSDPMIKPPLCLGEMKRLAGILAEGFPMCRVDFYVLDGQKIVFGELTFSPGKGCNAFVPQSFGDELGGFIRIPDCKV